MSTKEENKEINKNKLDEIYRLLLSLNAYGSLDLTDFNLIVNQIEKSFDVVFDTES